MDLLIVRGASGVVAWSKQPIDQHAWAWICGRDQFSVSGPAEPAQAEAVALAIVQHSIPFTGAVQQLVQVDL